MAKAPHSCRAVLASLLFLAATLLCSCGPKDTHEKIKEETLSQMEKVVGVVAQVKDKESAEKAAESLDAMVPAFESIADRANAIGEPDEATENALRKKFGARSEEIVQKMNAAMLGVATTDPSIMQTVQTPMEKIGEVLEKVR